MSYKTLNFRITGVSPLLCHNGQTADRLNDFARRLKKVSNKKNKTDADYAEMARIEWYAGLYLQDGKPCIPGPVIEAALAVGAKKSKRGKQVLAGVFCPNNAMLIYDGPKDVDELWKAGNHRLTIGVRVQRNKVMRTRPIFREWAADLEIIYDPLQLNEEDIGEILRTTGEVIGLCDWRPKFGRFVVA